MGYNLNQNDFKLTDYIRRYCMEVIDECYKDCEKNGIEHINYVKVKLAELPKGGLAPNE